MFILQCVIRPKWVNSREGEQSREWGNHTVLESGLSVLFNNQDWILYAGQLTNWNPNLKYIWYIIYTLTSACLSIGTFTQTWRCCYWNCYKPLLGEVRGVHGLLSIPSEVYHLHYDIMVWKYFQHYWPFVKEIFCDGNPSWGNHRWIPLTKGQWCGTLMIFPLTLVWKNVEQSVV